MAVEGVLVSKLRAAWLLLLLSPLSLLSFLVLLPAQAQALPSCPKRCSCPGQKEVHCTFRHFTSPPRNLPKDTERVNLGYNSLQALDGSEFTHLHQLEMLMLHGNDITTVSQGAFYSLRSLQILKLSYNKLKTVNPGILEGLVSLVRLHLDHNLITFIEPYSFTGLSSLKLLQLEGNQLADLHPHTFVTLSILGTFWGSSLRHLHLSDNRLQYLQAAVLQPLTRLEMLTLHGNPWTCDCQLHWLLEWNSKHEGVVKCKKERESGSSEICAACFSPQPLNGTQFLGLATEKLPCLRPSIESPLKQWDSPGWNEDDSEPDLPYTRDLEQPLGKMTIILSDSHGNTAHVQCDVQRPSESSSLSWEPLRWPGELSVNVTLVSVLECEIDRDALQNLWRLVAYYHESPAILERGPQRENTTQATFKYSQSANEDSPYFTDLKGHLMAKPAWLLQPRVTLQLNRRQTTTKKLVLDFTTVIFKHVGGRGQQEEEDGVDDITSSWALIRRGSGERIQTILEGSEVNLECDVISSASPTVQWMLPDLSILEASNAVMAVSERGGLVIGNASVSNAGLYHCLVRSQEGVDIVPVRLTVKERLLSPNALNGKKMTVKSGESLSLPCSVTSTLPSLTHWYLPNHHALLPSQQTGRVSVTPNGTLLIRKVGHEDAGEYGCVASNLYGVDMLAHLLVVMEDREEEKTGVADTERGKVLLLVDGEEDTEGSGFQEIKRHHTTQPPKKWGGGQQRNAGGGLRPGMKGKRVKDSKRKPNTSVKQLDPNRWAEILAKANAKAPTAQSTAPPLTVPSTKTTTRMVTETTVTTPTTTAAVTTSASTTTSPPPETTPEKNIIEIDDTTSKPATKSKSKVVTVTQTPHLPITRTMDKHAGDGRTGPKIPPGWMNRRRPPYRRGRPLLRPVHPLKPSTRKPHTIPPQPLTVTTAVTTTTTTTTTTEATSEEDDQNTDESDHSARVDSQKSASSVYSDEEEGKDDSEALGATSKPDIIHAKSTVGKESGISTSQHFSRPNMMPTPEPHIRPSPISKVYIVEEGLDSSIEEVVVRQIDNRKQTTSLLAITTPSPTLSYDMNFKPPPLHHAVTMATSVLRNVDVLDSKAPDNPIINKHESYSPARHKEEDSTPNMSITHDNPSRKDLLKPFHTDRDRKKEVEESFKPITESPRYSKPLPVHPWMQQHIQRRGQTQLSPRSPYHTPHKPSFHHPGGSRVQERPLPVTHRPRPIPHLWGHGSWVTNRPEITAETVKPTAFIHGSSGPVDAPLTPQTPLISQTRDLILLSKLRNRYRQAQLDRIALLGKRVTPWPRMAHPTPHPKLPLITNPTHLSWLVPATTSPPLPRLHPTASILHGGHWNHGRWSPPQKQVTALPFPGPMGNGAKPRITTVNTVSVSALAESDVFLSCEVSGDPAPALSWTKVSTGATIPANTKHGPRFEVLKNGTFVIKTVQLQDRGQYLCTAQNRFGSDRMVVTLAVLTQPPRILSPTSTEVSLYLGKSISLDCLASGKPPAQISWILPDRTFVRDAGISMNRMGALLLPNGTLRIQSADFSNKGHYKCIASNAAGADTVTYHVHVAALPPTITEGTAESITIQPGKSVFVHCSAKGEPAPALKWTLAAGVHVKPSQFLGRRLFVFPNGTLYIRNILPVDAGKYECSATNVVGVAKRTLNLEVRQDQPNLRQPPLSPSLPQRQVVSHPTQQHKVTAMYGSTVYLHCPESTSSPRGTVWQLPSRTILEHRYSPERPVRAFPNGTLRILQLTEVDGGSYLCMFQRPNGEDMELFQVEVLMTPPKIEHMGTAQKRVTYGENFQVDCVASGLPDPEVTWSLPDGTVINNALQSDDSGTRSRRYVIFGNGTLLLQQMGKKDEGNYTCYAKNKLGEDERKVSVKVGPEAPRISKAQSSVIARLGESASLACPATGEPPPNILWLTSNDEVISTYTSAYLILADGTLVIKKVTAADQGTYTCVARNSVGEDVKNMKLEVQARAPHINDQGGRSSMKILAVSYQTTILDCRATGKPEPHLKWTTPYGLSLPTPYMGGRFQVHKNGSLELRGLRKSDEGLYVCLAKNQFGEASLSVDLEVASLAEKPSFAMPNIEILPIKQDGGAVMLECPARGKPNPEFVWILPNGTAMSPGAQFQRFTHYLGNGTLRISRPVATDKGVYRCLAKNVAGLAEKRYALEAGRKPIIRGTTGGMKITYGHSLNLPCTVDAWPQAAITWTLPNGLVLDKTQSIGRVTFLANGTLLLREIATFDRGNYVCKATNTFGSSTLSYPVAVMVYPPRITSAPASITRVNRGKPATLSCVAAGIPKPDITWTLPGRTTLVPNNRFTAQGGIHMTEEGSLVLQDPGLMNSGIYKCNAKNALGTDFKATYVQVI